VARASNQPLTLHLSTQPAASLTAAARPGRAWAPSINPMGCSWTAASGVNVTAADRSAVHFASEPVGFRGHGADAVGMTRESVDTLATRRLRAAADRAYASRVYSAAVDDATFRGARPELDAAVLAAAAYAEQTRLVFESARIDHQRAVDAAARRPRDLVSVG
jgi:hypothetical protein